MLHGEQHASKATMLDVRLYLTHTPSSTPSLRTFAALGNGLVASTHDELAHRVDVWGFVVGVAPVLREVSHAFRPEIRLVQELVACEYVGILMHYVHDGIHENVCLPPVPLVAELVILRRRAFNQCGGPNRVARNTSSLVLRGHAQGSERHAKLGHGVRGHASQLVQRNRRALGDDMPPACFTHVRQTRCSGCEGATCVDPHDKVVTLHGCLAHKQLPQ